ncbi:MAG TPA: hypothetical protein VNY31_07630 [Solirubrobacteraceae bacterium]|nr:hypothetical protein [Solirubrobacteraceae bacterium]
MSAPRPIAVVLEGPPTPAWQARALAGFEASDALEVVALHLVGGARRGIAQRLHGAGERHIFTVGDDPHAPIRVEARVTDAPATLVVWLVERPPPDDEPRELLWLHHEGLAEPVEDAFRRALLSGSPCLVSEVMLRAGTSTVVVARTVSAVGPYSEAVSRTLALWKLAALLPRAVERLPGLDELAAAPEQMHPPPPPSRARLLMRDLASWLRAPARRLVFRRPWRIRVRERADAPTRGWERENGLVRWGDALVYADPFIFEHDGRHHLFCEEVPRGSKQGVISHTELRVDGTPAETPTPVLQAPYHLSYPCVFAHEGEIFMIPETGTVRRIELYRAVSFPDAWEREAILVDDIGAVDTTLFEHGGRLWLFTAVAASGASYSDELHLFWAEAPRGPWQAHPGNPVVSDVRGARPAGAIQRWGPRLVRPAQDCSRRYGWAVSFREIDVLTDTAYGEHEIDRLEPANLADARATHTYAADGRFEAVDLRQRELRLRRGA